MEIFLELSDKRLTIKFVGCDWSDFENDSDLSIVEIEPKRGDIDGAVIALRLVLQLERVPCQLK
jgi:hypothetical protein